MATLQEIPTLDTAIEPQMSSWSSLPAGILLLIKASDESPDIGTEYYLLINDTGNRLLIQ